MHLILACSQARWARTNPLLAYISLHLHDLACDLACADQRLPVCCLLDARVRDVGPQRLVAQRSTLPSLNAELASV